MSVGKPELMVLRRTCDRKTAYHSFSHWQCIARPSRSSANRRRPGNPRTHLRQNDLQQTSVFPLPELDLRADRSCSHQMSRMHKVGEEGCSTVSALRPHRTLQVRRPRGSKLLLPALETAHRDARQQRGRAPLKAATIVSARTRLNLLRRLPRPTRIRRSHMKFSRHLSARVPR
jgi:hypothetical protein